MADQKPAVDAAGGNKKKKILLIGAAAAAVLLLVALAAVLLLRDRGEDEAAGKVAATAAPPATIYASLGDKFVVVLQEDGTQRYLQTSLTVLTHDETVLKALEVHAPLIRGRLVALLGAQDFASLRSEQGKLALRDRILATVQEVLQSETGQPGVEQVFFTEFVLQ
jgi:flagellar FliL protein